MKIDVKCTILYQWRVLSGNLYDSCLKPAWLQTETCLASYWNLPGFLLKPAWLQTETYTWFSTETYLVCYWYFNNQFNAQYFTFVDNIPQVPLLIY